MQAECQFTLAGITLQLCQFQHVVGILPQEVAADVIDILTAPLPDTPHDVLKAAILDRTMASERQRLSSPQTFSTFPVSITSLPMCSAALLMSIILWPRTMTPSRAFKSTMRDCFTYASLRACPSAGVTHPRHLRHVVWHIMAIPAHATAAHGFRQPALPCPPWGSCHATLCLLAVCLAWHSCRRAHLDQVKPGVPESKDHPAYASFTLSLPDSR